MLAKCGAVVGLALAAIGILVIFSVSDASAQGAVEKARLGRTMWSAFQCGTFAEMSGDQKEQARLFEVGVKAGRDFIEAIRSGQIPADVANREVPIGVSMLLQGPSTDFIMGRVFENAMSDAFDGIVTRDDKGIGLDPAKWENNAEIRKIKAENKYLAGNCVLLK